MEVMPRLACRQCKQRKLRCDKGFPCNACRASGLACSVVERGRLPRGKSAQTRKKKSSLESRVRQLESLLEQHNELNRLQLSEPGRSGSDINNSRLLAPDFWSSLSDNVSGLREVLENSDDENDNYFARDESPDLSKQSALTTRLMLFSSVDLQDHGQPVPSPARSAVLFEIFRVRVDTVYKVVHFPSVLTSFNLASSSSTPTTSNLALQYAMYFMALCTVSDDEAHTMGLGPRAELLKSYRNAAENYLASSGLLDHPDLTALQAFIIYLIGLRTCLNSAAAWTLVAVAARIAMALRLGDENACKFTNFELEVRRRALYAIGVLDTHAALDRGTVPVLPATAFRVSPLELDDSDLSPDIGVRATPSAAITEMTHSVMTYKAMLCQRRIYELCQKGDSSWLERLTIVAGFEAHVEDLKHRIGDARSPMHILLLTSGQKIHRSLELLLRRPPYRQPSDSVPFWDSFDIMLAATEVLELHLRSPPPEIMPWTWKNWVQWHALAVVLAELLVRPSDPLADRAFEVASNSFRYYSCIVADSQSGMLWRPIAKLMHRVQCLRQAPLASQGSPAVQRGVNNMRDYADTDLSPWNQFGAPELAERYTGYQTMSPLVDQESDSLALNHDQMPFSAWETFLDSIVDTTAWD